MENSKNLRFKSILALLAIFLSVPFLVINASETPKLDAAIKKVSDPSLNGHHDIWMKYEVKLNKENVIMLRLLSELGDLSGLLRTTDSAIAAAALEYVASLGELSPGTAAANMAQIVSGIRDKASLDSAIESKEYEIHDQVSKVKSADTARNTALSDLHTYITNTYNSNGTPSDDLELPDPIHTPLIRQFTCRGNCTDKFDSPVYARVSHRFPCRYKPHNDITHNPFVYYDCPSVTTDDTCPLANEHWVECRECDELCPPPRLVVVDQSIFGMDGYIEYGDHEEVCQEEAKKLIGWGTCNERYFTCQTTVCPNDGNHKVAGACGKSGHYEKKGDANAIAKHARINLQCPVKHTYSSGTQVQCQIVYVYQCDPSHHPNHNFPSIITSAPNNIITTPPDTTPSPSMHACGVHETSVSGDHSAASCGTSGHYNCDSSDHSLQASCTSTDSNGSSCTVTGFYACASPHTHQYPTPDPNTATCANGHTYNPNNTSQYNRHRTRTCRYSECGNTWEKCVSNTPKCNKPYRKARGKYCWAIE